MHRISHVFEWLYSSCYVNATLSTEPLRVRAKPQTCKWLLIRKATGANLFGERVIKSQLFRQPKNVRFR